MSVSPSSLGSDGRDERPDNSDRTVIRPADAVVPAVGGWSGPESNDGSALAVGTRLGEFELVGVIGVGGFGIVYRAQDHSLGRRVALKEYMPSMLAERVGDTLVQVRSERHRDTFDAGLRSFVNEARLLAQFDHPSLVKVYRFWEGNGTAYMVMPLYEGKTLKDMLRALDGPPDEARLRALLHPLTEALMVLHAAHCYHRDVAPDNVMMLAGSNRPLLLDFGAARQVIGDMTQALTVILKPGYAPIEQYAEIPGMKQGPWTDIYALAGVVHQAITGRTPPPSVSRLVGDSQVPLVQSAAGRYSERFLAALDHALAVRPEDRTQSVAQLRAELGLDDAPDSAPDGRASAAGAPMRRETAKAVAAAASAAAAAGGDATPPPSAARLGRPAVLLASAVAAALVAALAGYAVLSRSPDVPPLPAAGADAGVPATVAPPAPVAAPQAPAAPWSMEAVFDRVLQAQTPGLGVTALPNKTALRIGRDELSFTVTSQRDGFLSVQLYGSDGVAMLLYPNDQTGPVKVREGQPLRLPKPPVVLTTTGPAGPNLLLVMVSANERDYSALKPRSDGPYQILPSGDQAQRLDASLRHGPVPAQAGTPRCPGGGSGCPDDYGAVLMRVDAVN
jgi:hypothetical protein